MSGDYSRDSFDALRDFAGVFLQQGRAVLDSDWNEMVAVLERRIRAGTVDTIGRAVVPRETMSGFEVQFDGGGSLEIGRGRLYLDGMLLECHGAADFSGADPTLPAPVFDRACNDGGGAEGVLDEMISPDTADYVRYLGQPYWPTPEPLPETGAHLVYLVAWQRELTPVMAPELLEPALGGIDTTTRWQTVWQVRLFENVPENTTCSTPDADIDGWSDAIAPSTARLTTGTIEIDDPENPCLVPPTDGYSGIENQLYRLELHTVGDGQTDARFKFSRENASVSASVESIGAPANRMTVSRIGRDDVLRFRAGNWVEITDTHREFNHRSGQMLRISAVHEETREIEFEQTIDADLIPTGLNGDTLAARSTRLTRWDQSGILRLTNGTQWADLDDPLSDGLVPVPPAGQSVVLESGITVDFSTAAGAGRFREMDYWIFAARTAGTQIEELRSAPPAGVQRHYTRLAIARWPDTISDCRVFWPPAMQDGGEGCACTVCVSPEAHNSGALTIQEAIDQVGPLGGTVCLEAGAYLLTAPVSVSSRAGLTVRGQGIGTLLAYQGGGAAIRVDGAVDLQLEDFTVLAASQVEDANGNRLAAHGIAAQNTGLMSLRRLAVLVPGAGEARRDHGIAIDGVAVGTKIEECVVVAPVALGNLSSFDGFDDDVTPGYVALAELRVLDCIFYGQREAVRFARLALNLAAARMARNLCLGNDAGIRINWVEIPAASTAIDASTILSNADALILGATDSRVQDCDISGGPNAGNGIRLAPSLVPELPSECQIIGNSIFDLAGAGISIGGIHESLLIKRNRIRDCGTGGIFTAPEARIAHIAIDNNILEDIATTRTSASAVLLTMAGTGQIIGNSINGVGANGSDGETYAGIAVQGIGSVAIESNAISRIGPSRPEARSVAVLARPPYLGLVIDGNRVVGRQGGGDGNAINRSAIRIGSGARAAGSVTDDVAVEVPGYPSEVPGVAPQASIYALAGDTYMRMSAESLVAAVPRAAVQIRVSGNQVNEGEALLRPLIEVVDRTVVSLSFDHNQCSLHASGGLPEVVLLTAQRVMANGNSILHTTDSTSMRLSAAAATPVGNITTSGISLNGGAVPAPFDALNVQA